jgi:hypothetical protein
MDEVEVDICSLQPFTKLCITKITSMVLLRETHIRMHGGLKHESQRMILKNLTRQAPIYKESRRIVSIKKKKT